MVVILTAKISDRAILLGNLWKSIGFKTCLIYINESIVFNKIENFDFVLQGNNEEECIALANKLNDKDIIHYLNYGPDKMGVCLIQSGMEYLYDYKDMWANVRIPKISADAAIVEKAIVDRSVAITNRDQQIINFAKQNQIDISKKLLFYLPEYLDIANDPDYELSLIKSSVEIYFDDDPVKIVTTGGYQDSRDASLVSDDGMGLVLNGLAQQGCLIDVIGGFSNVNSYNLTAGMVGSYHPNVQFLKGMPSKDFEKKLLSYDFALLALNRDFFETNTSMGHANGHLDYCGSARVISYVKANLPIVMGDTLKSNLDRMSGTPFPVVIEKSEFLKTVKILNKLKKINYKNRLFEARKVFDYRSIKDQFFCFASSILVTKNRM